MSDFAEKEESESPSEYDIPNISEHSTIRYLHFSSPWIQGGMELSDPYVLIFEYARQMMAWLLFRDPPKMPTRIGILGLGAAGFVRYTLKYTTSSVVCVEWNPLVVQACQLYFKLPSPSKRFELLQADAGVWVADENNHGSCGILLVDLYDSDAQGPVRESYEFYDNCRSVISHSRQTGVMAVNLFGDYESFPRNVATIQKVFGADRVWVMPEMEAGNRIVMAFTGPSITVKEKEVKERAYNLAEAYHIDMHAWIGSLFKKGEKERTL